MSVYQNLVVFLVGLLLAVAVSFLMSFPVFLLWNGCLVDAINGVREVTWLQAWGLMLLCAMLFGTSMSATSKS